MSWDQRRGLHMYWTWTWHLQRFWGSELWLCMASAFPVEPRHQSYVWPLNFIPEFLNVEIIFVCVMNDIFLWCCLYLWYSFVGLLTLLPMFFIFLLSDSKFLLSCWIYPSRYTFHPYGCFLIQFARCFPLCCWLCHLWGYWSVLFVNVWSLYLRFYLFHSTWSNSFFEKLWCFV